MSVGGKLAILWHGQWDEIGYAALDWDGEDLGVAAGGGVVGAEEDGLAVGEKATGMSAAGWKVRRRGMPLVADGEDVRVAIVFAAEGDGPAVGREDGCCFDAHARTKAGHPAAVAATVQRSPA